MRQDGPIVLSNGTVTVEPEASGVAYSDTFDLCGLNDFAVEYKVACTGTPDVKIEVQQKSESADADWATPENMAAIEESLTDKNQHCYGLSPITLRYLRFKVTEQTTTVSDTVVTLIVSGQRKFAS